MAQTQIGEKTREDELKRIKTPSSGRRADLRYALYLARRNPLVLAGSAIAIVSIALALLSGYIVNPTLWEFKNGALQICWNNPVIYWGSNIYKCPGSTIYPLGTDKYGRNLLDMIILSLPTDLGVSFTIVLASFAIGIVFGSIAAYAAGKLDEAILRITDVFFAIPPLILAIVIVATLGKSRPTLFDLTLAVLVTWWPLYVRLIRSQVLSEKEKPYVEALRALGAGRFRILFLHILPNSIYPAIVQLTLDIGGVILIFSSLMFLGFSPNPLLPELGNLVTDGIQFVATAPWLIIFPGLTILIIALGFNLLGDGIRDILDPRLRR
jgi:peptide/nickel transport system permease protein